MRRPAARQSEHTLYPALEPRTFQCPRRSSNHISRHVTNKFCTVYYIVCLSEFRLQFRLDYAEAHTLGPGDRSLGGDLAGVRRDVQAPQRRDGARDLGLSQEGHDAKHRQAAVVDLRAQPGKPRIRRNRNDSCTAKDDGSSGKRCAESEKKRSTILKIQRILFEDTPRVTSPPSTRPTCSSAG